VFHTIVENPDLSIVSNPVSPRVAVACRWKNAHTFRKRYPFAAVVGPLRTVRGIDLMIRSLLANPQIRVVIVDGPDLTPNDMTTTALLDLWKDGTRPPGMGEDLTNELVDIVIKSVTLLIQDSSAPDIDVDVLTATEDRAGGQHILPPPAPVATSTAPHGDPGERVVGDRLSDVWPGVLQRILSFGEEVPSKYGATRECLNLVSVYRDPRGLLEEVHAGEAPWLGFGVEEMEDYARRVTTPWSPDDAPYSYGTRIGADGFANVTRLLTDKLPDRGIGVSPWHAVDAAGGRGRPCLVWVQFRHVANALHLQFVFRSHDYFAAYPMNVAALASWLVREAESHDLEVGTMTCLSVSAHLYDRDWNDALQIVDTCLPHGYQWDQRSTWRVEVIPGDPDLGYADSDLSIHETGFTTTRGTAIRATALTPDGVEVVGVFEGRTAQAVQRKIEWSGLLTSVGNAMWLGRELAKAEANIP